MLLFGVRLTWVWVWCVGVMILSLELAVGVLGTLGSIFQRVLVVVDGCIQGGVGREGWRP